MACKPACLLALAVALTVTGALAAEPPAVESDQKQICRGAAKQLGSRIRTTRRCRTAEQWREEDEQKSRLPSSLQVTEGQNDGHAATPPR